MVTKFVAKEGGEKSEKLIKPDQADAIEEEEKKMPAPQDGAAKGPGWNAEILDKHINKGGTPGADEPPDPYSDDVEHTNTGNLFTP